MVVASSFRAAAVIYPYCRDLRPWGSGQPVLVLLAGQDDVTPPRFCEELLTRVPNRNLVETRVYPEARHAFDVPTLPAVAPFSGDSRRTVGYNADAAAQAWKALTTFLDRHLKDGR
jgi:dienelactone hydrolase